MDTHVDRTPPIDPSTAPRPRPVDRTAAATRTFVNDIFRSRVSDEYSAIDRFPRRIPTEIYKLTSDRVALCGQVSHNV